MDDKVVAAAKQAFGAKAFCVENLTFKKLLIIDESDGALGDVPLRPLMVIAIDKAFRLSEHDRDSLIWYLGTGFDGWSCTRAGDAAFHHDELAEDRIRAPDDAQGIGELRGPRGGRDPSLDARGALGTVGGRRRGSRADPTGDRQPLRSPLRHGPRQRHVPRLVLTIVVDDVRRS
jgi:hypothetical protein